MVHAHATMVGGDGVETEMSHCTVLSGARVFLYCVITCRQQRLPTSPQQAATRMGLPGWLVCGKAKASGRVDVYTQGQQGSGC